jgi:hypothetical protein
MGGKGFSSAFPKQSGKLIVVNRFYIVGGMGDHLSLTY